MNSWAERCQPIVPSASLCLQEVIALPLIAVSDVHQQPFGCTEEFWKPWGGGMFLLLFALASPPSSSLQQKFKGWEKVKTHYCGSIHWEALTMYFIFLFDFSSSRWRVSPYYVIVSVYYSFNFLFLINAISLTIILNQNLILQVKLIKSHEKTENLISEWLISKINNLLNLEVQAQIWCACMAQARRRRLRGSHPVPVSQSWGIRSFDRPSPAASTHGTRLEASSSPLSSTRNAGVLSLA